MMLQRATSGLYGPNRWVNWRRGLVGGPTSILLKYVAVVAIVTAIGCLYLWQTSDLRQTQLATNALRRQRIDLEQDNVNLVNQLALWNTPAYVDAKGRAGGFVTPQTYVVLDSFTGAEQVVQTPSDDSQ